MLIHIPYQIFNQQGLLGVQYSGGFRPIRNKKPMRTVTGRRKKQQQNHQVNQSNPQEHLILDTTEKFCAELPYSLHTLPPSKAAFLSYSSQH